MRWKPLAPAALAIALVALFVAAPLGCGRPRGLYVGEILIPAEELDAAVEEMRGSFPQYGTDTLRWHLLDHGMGPAAILHHRFGPKSEAARQEALRWRARVEAGEDFAELVREQRKLLPEETPYDPPRQPRPVDLGARVAAATASLEPGEWTGPLKTKSGWEIIYLDERFDEVRNRSGVRLLRMVFEPDEMDVMYEALDEADRLWNGVTSTPGEEPLPLSGTTEYLLALPIEFRRGRVASGLLRS